LRTKAKAGKRSLDTVRFYKSYLAPWLDLSGPNTPITDFTKEEIVEAWDIWTSEGHSLSVCHARHRALQAALALAERVGWIDASPARMLRFERPQPRARKASDAELEALITTADALAITTNDPRWSAMATAIIAAVWTAQRQGDLLTCDLTRQLKQHPISQSWHLHFIQNKTGAKVGIPLMPALAARLDGRTTGPLISVGNVGTTGHWNKHTFRHMFADLRTKAGVQDLEFRDLRDTAITRLYEAGATAEQIASWSGHTLASVVAILKHYIDHQQAVADDVGDMLALYAAKRGIRY
jgi:integrase